MSYAILYWAPPGCHCRKPTLRGMYFELGWAPPPFGAGGFPGNRETGYLHPWYYIIITLNESKLLYYQHSDIDECSNGVDNCSQYASCTNTLGSYNCTCIAGYLGDGFDCSEYIHTLPTKFALMSYDVIIWDFIHNCAWCNKVVLLLLQWQCSENNPMDHTSWLYILTTSLRLFRWWCPSNGRDFLTWRPCWDMSKQWV